MSMRRSEVIEHYLIPLRRALLVTVAIGTFMVSVPSAAACTASGPSMLGLFLAGRGLSDAVHGELVEAMSRVSTEEQVKSLSALDHALGDLNLRVWGLYWVSVYSRRLHEVLDKLDSNPPGPVTLYYDRWDRTQLIDSVAMVNRETVTVDDLLARTRGLSSEQSSALQQHLGRIRKELLGCATE